VIFVLRFLLNHEDLFRILPEVVLTLTGVAVMLLDAAIPPRWPRRPLGWVAAIGTTLALWASQCQLALPEGTSFSGTVETSRIHSLLPRAHLRHRPCCTLALAGHTA